jgi:hypothetical protein
MPVLIIVAPAPPIAFASQTHLSERAALRDQVEHRQAVDQDEVPAPPRRARGDDLDRRTACAFE